MTQERSDTFGKALRAVVVAAMLLLVNGMAMADGDTPATPQGVRVHGSVYGGGNLADVKVNTEVNMSTGHVYGNIFGGGKGSSKNFECDSAMVGVNNEGAGKDLSTEENKVKGTKVIISNGTVGTLEGTGENQKLKDGTGSVYGGGEIGRVEWNTQVTIGESNPSGDDAAPVIYGSVFGAGKGLETHGYSALVRGNSTVVVQGNAKVEHNVYGGGEKATAGRYWVKGINNSVSGAPEAPSDLPDGMPYKQQSGGECRVTVQGSAQIGPDTGASDDAGHVFGAGKGVNPQFTEGTTERMVNTADGGELRPFVDDNTTGKTAKELYLEFLQTLALVTNTYVTIDGGATVKGSVYGGSESGFVQTNTDVDIQGGTINGDAFGGGLGFASFAEAGKVKGNTDIAVSGGAVEGNVYGGGRMGDVGIIDKTDENEGQLTYNYKWKQSDGITANDYWNNKITGENNNTGICKVTVSGGTIGVESPSDPTAQGNVFGAGEGLATTWWCEKAIAYATDVSVTGGTVRGNVYGGGQIGRVEDDAKVVIGEANATGNAAPVITGSVFGAGAGLKTHGYSALVRGNAEVTVQGVAQVNGSVYGGGEIASVGRFHVVRGLPKNPQAGGTCTVKIKDNAIIGSGSTGHNVFGACKGVTPAYNNTKNDSNRSKSMQLEANRPKETVTDPETGVETETVKAEHDFWDYCEDYPNDYEGTKFVWVYYETETDYLNFLKTLALTSNTHVTVDGSSEVHGSVYGGGERGITLGGVDINITGGTVSQDVYGGGALADSNTAMWDATNNRLHDYVPLELLPGLSVVTGYYKGDNHELVTTEGATAGVDEELSYSAIYKTKVNLLGGTVTGDVYGGGLGQLEAGTSGQAGYVTPIEAKVYGDVFVNLNGFDKNEVKYVAATHGATTGEGARLELVGDEYLVKDDVKGAIVSHIFGCNNLNGSPKGKVKVHVFKTQRTGQTRITNPDPAEGNQTAKVYGSQEDGEYVLTTFDVKAVYGGGNMAAYVPADLTNGTTQVVIDGCDRTSIGQVYGGGNAASTPATKVTVNGTYEIGELFGGGNGKDRITFDGLNYRDNPGANVGFYDYHLVENEEWCDEKEERDPDATPSRMDDRFRQYIYGIGKAEVNVFGGLIHHVFGGSNTKGNVRKTALTLLEEKKDGEDEACCPFQVDEAYGGGKSAPMDAEAKLLMACIPGLKAAYGGAQAADVQDNVTLTITNGTFDRIFGGNNISGTIRGSITVNIEETGCRPIIIGELYGGGNLAGYSVYGYKNVPETVTEEVTNPNGTTTQVTKVVDRWLPLGKDPEDELPSAPLYDDPVVNVKAFTSIGNVYGGGYGESAVMVGDPTVNINVAMGERASETAAEIGKVDDETWKDMAVKDGVIVEKTVEGSYPIPYHKSGAIGAINNVFGGGNAAKVVGKTTVNVGTRIGEDEYMAVNVEAGKALPTLPEGESYYTRSGTAPDYTYTPADDTIAEEGTTYYKKYTFKGADIRGNVYGGGNQAEVTGDADVIIGKKM